MTSQRKFGLGWVVTLLAAICSFACSDDGDETAAGSGSLTITITGEDGAKDGFPFEEDGESIAFADDWKVQFSKFIVAVGNIELAGADGKTAIASSDGFIVDLHKSDGELATFHKLGARRWERFSYEILPASDDMVNVNGVAAGDVSAMVDGGFNYWLEGSAEKAGDTYTFAWGLKNPTRNANCTNGSDDSEGLVITDNATADGEMTFHVDHVFWTTLGSEEAQLRFDAIAAAGRGDMDITWEDLQGQKLADLVGLDGQPLVDEEGEPLIYNPGSVRLASQDLASFILASTSSLAHLNGEGLCTITALE